MKTLNLFLSLALLTLAFASCNSGPAFTDKVNQNAYQSIEMGMTFDQVQFKLGGLEGKVLTEDPATNYQLVSWSNGDITNSTYTIAVSFVDGKSTQKFGTETNEKGEVIKEESYPY